MARPPAALLLSLSALLASCSPPPRVSGTGQAPAAVVAGAEVRETESARLETKPGAALDSLVEALGDPDPARRDDAENALERGGSAALESLRAAALAPDPERDVRIARLIRRLSSEYRLVRRAGPRRCAVVSPDGRHVVSYDPEGGYVLEDVQSGDRAWKCAAAGFVRPAGDLPTEPLIPCFWKGGTEVLVQTGPGLIDSLLVKNGDRAHTLRIYEPDNGLGGGRILVACDRVFVAHASGIYPLRLDSKKDALESLTGMRLIYSSTTRRPSIVGPDATGNLVGFRGPHVAFYDPKTLKLLAPPEMVTPPCDFMAAPSDASVLYLASGTDGILRTLRLAPAQAGPSHRLPVGCVSCLAVSADGLTLAVGTPDNTVVVLDAVDFRPYAELVLNDSPEHVALSDDGQVLGVSAGDEIRLFARPTSPPSPGR